MKQKTRTKNPPATPDAAATASQRADHLVCEIEELRESSRRKFDELARAGTAREKILAAVLATEDGRNLELARMLHDNVGQHVAALLLGLQALEKECTASGNARITLQSLHAIAESIGHELHRIALELRPTSLDDHGLALSLRTFLEEWSVLSKIAVHFDPVSLGNERMPRHIELTLFRMVSDVLQSVLQPPGASHVSVILKREHGIVTAIIEALGARHVGVEPRHSPRQGGLAKIHPRVALLGGTVTVERRAGGGTTVFARLPLPDTAPAS